MPAVPLQRDFHSSSRIVRIAGVESLVHFLGDFFEIRSNRAQVAKVRCQITCELCFRNSFGCCRRIWNQALGYNRGQSAGLTAKRPNPPEVFTKHLTRKGVAANPQQVA